nr:ribonuclease H-like domain-containing protein [Tanacetum cinerariifolium]
MNTLKIKPKQEDVNMKFLRGLPPSWSGIALILKTKGGLEYISFDDLYNKLKFLEIDAKGYLLSLSTLSNAAFVSTAGSSQGNLSYQESGNNGYTTTRSVSPGSSSSKGSSKSKCNVVDDVIYSFSANHDIDQHLVYEDLDQINKEEFEEYDLKHQMEMLSIKQIGHFSRECRAQGGKNSNNYLKYKSKEAGKDGSDSKAMVVVDGSINWDNQTKEGNTEPRALENFGMIVGIKIESDADSDGEVVYADNAIPAGVFVSAGDVAAVVSPQSETDFALMGLSTEGKPIYNRFASVDHMKAVPPPLTGNYMPPSNIPDIDESQMMYRKKDTNSSEIKTNDDNVSHSNDSVLFDFSDSISAPASESRDTIVIDCDRQEDFTSVCNIETDVKSSKTLCNKFGSFNKESHFRKHKYVASKSCYVCGSYLHLIKDYDLHEQRLAKRNAKGKGKLGRRPTGKPVNPNRPKPVSAGQQNPVSAGLPNSVSAEQQNTVFAAQPNPVSAGQPNPVSASKATLACNSIPLSISA